MRVSQRQIDVAIKQTELEIKLHEYAEVRSLTNVALLQAVAGLKVKILKAMRRRSEFIADPARGSRIDFLVYNFAREDILLTDIEILQALTSFEQGQLKYMLRYERHGNYDKPAGLE